MELHVESSRRGLSQPKYPLIPPALRAAVLAFHPESLLLQLLLISFLVYYEESLPYLIIRNREP